jgi:hypothetical protein
MKIILNIHCHWNAIFLLSNSNNGNSLVLVYLQYLEGLLDECLSSFLLLNNQIHNLQTLASPLKKRSFQSRVFIFSYQSYLNFKKKLTVNYFKLTDKGIH